MLDSSCRTSTIRFLFLSLCGRLDWRLKRTIDHANGCRLDRHGRRDQRFVTSRSCAVYESLPDLGTQNHRCGRMPGTWGRSWKSGGQLENFIVRQSCSFSGGVTSRGVGERLPTARYSTVSPLQPCRCHDYRISPASRASRASFASALLKQPTLS